MKNIHWRLFALILLLVAGSIYAAVVMRPRLGLDIQGGMRVVLRAKKEDLRHGKWSRESLDTIANIIRSRVDALGVAEPVIYTKPDSDQVIVELPGIRDKQQALQAIQTTARLEFRYVEELERDWQFDPEVIGGKETGYQVITGPNGPISEEELNARVFSKEPVLAGDELEPNSRAELTSQGTVIHFEFKGQSKRVFESFTRSHIGKKLAIFLDKKLISAPGIDEPIPGVGIIRGSFTPEQARMLAGQLNAGALPVPLELMQQQTLEATLGREAMHQTLFAGIIGLAIVLIYMILYYRLPGVLASIALLLYTLFAYAVFVGGLSWLGFPGVTMTVPGIAGFILSIGMAVDANILIFERMREERVSGKSIRASIEAGFKRAFTAIFDSNVCTMITCVILYSLGTGAVRGFAITLGIGVVLSMFTAITCSRTFLLILAGTPLGQNDRFYTLRNHMEPRLHVSKRIPLWFGISAALMVPGLIAWIGLNGIKYSIEFTGGTEAIVRFDKRVTAGDITSAMNKAGFEDARVVLAEGNRAFITTAALKDPKDQARSRAAIENLNGHIESLSSVSGAISRELRTNAFWAVLLASGVIVVYLAIRFAIGGLMEGFKFGVCAIAATLHDVAILWGLFALFGLLLGWQVDLLFITALLTTIGFSTHDTIVIFDRLRENLRLKSRSDTFADVTDRSVDQTFARSINTSVTVMITLTALLIWGGPVIRVFGAALLIGVIIGTYSSIFNASPLLVIWRRVAANRQTAAAGSSQAARPAQRVAQPTSRTSSASDRPASAADPASEAAATPHPRPAGPGPAAAKARSAKRKRRM